MWGQLANTWLTNYGGLAYSDDGGSIWTRDPYMRWDNVFGTSQFQVSSMVPDGDYVYMFGTQFALRLRSAARVRREDVLNKTAYQYWRDGRWTPTRDANAARCSSAVRPESSVRHNAAADRWEMTYLDPVRSAIMIRTSRTPQEAWSEPARRRLTY